MSQSVRTLPFATIPDRPLRCIIVGMGGISSTMLRHLTPAPWYTTAAVVDVRAEALDRAQEQLALDKHALFTDLERALGETETDVVIINTPSELHFAQTKQALEAGCHVLVAKPITNNFEEAAALVELAEQQQLSLCVGQQMRYNRHYTAVGRFLAGGRLGKTEMGYFLSAKPRHKALNLAKMEQPALYEMSCHHFDSLLSLFPDRAPERITIDGFQPSWSVYAGPCSLNGLLHFSDGLHLLYHGGFSSQADMYELRVEGTAGALRCRGIHMSNDAMDYEVAERGGPWQPYAVDDGIPAQNPWVHFFAHWRHYLSHGAMANGSEPPFTGRNNLKVFAMLSAGIDSLQSGQPVEIAGNPRYAPAFA